MVEKGGKQHLLPPEKAQKESKMKGKNLKKKAKTPLESLVFHAKNRKNQCKMKKISSFIKSPAPVLGLSKPLLFASISRILAMISIVFLAE